MTYENCVKYRDEAQDEKTKNFWNERIARKYPDKVEEELGNNAEPIVEINEDQDPADEVKPKKRKKK